MKAIDVLGCAGWAGLFLSMPVWLPLFGPFFSLLTPLPFFYYSIRLGFRQGLKLTALVLAVFGFAAHLAGGTYLAVFGLEFGVLGLMLAALMEKGLTPGQTVLTATAVMVALGLGFLTYLAAGRNMGPGEMIMAYLEAQLQASLQAYQQMGLAPSDGAELQAFSQSFLGLMSKIYVSLMVIGTGVVVWLNMVAGRILLRARQVEFRDTMSLDRWHSPEWLVWVLIAAGFGVFFGSGRLSTVSLNVLIVTMAVYLFQGFSIILFFMNRYRVPRWARVGVYVVIFMQQFLMLVLALAGLFDQWVDFRKLRRKESENS